jgi:rod shape-determining protein MreB
MKGLLGFLNRFVGSFSSRDIGIDLGTCNTLVYVKEEGVIIDEPSVVAVNSKTGKVLLNGNAVGKVAKEMLDYNHNTIKVIRPLKCGEISDFEATRAMLNYFIKCANNGYHVVRPKVVVAIPHAISEVDKRAVIESTIQAGGRKVYLIEESFAAGIGAGLNVTQPKGYMVVDIGGGTTTIAILALGGIIKCEELKIAGDQFDQAIIDHIKRKYNMLIGPQTAERIKIEIGSSIPLEKEMEIEVRGLDLGSNLPRKLMLSSVDVRDALDKPVGEILTAIRKTFENVSGEISADLAQQGMLLCGGGAFLRGLDERIKQEVSIPVKIADDPLRCVIKGVGTVVEKLEQFKETLEGDNDLL